MVAYSFRRQFVEPILSGSKRQTIRADRKRHARPGEEVQLYTGMRTKHCRLIGTAVVRSVNQIRLQFTGQDQGYSHTWSESAPNPTFSCWDLHKPECNEFARRDGFKDWRELKTFWAAEHPGLDRFEGVLITWGPLLP